MKNKFKPFIIALLFIFTITFGASAQLYVPTQQQQQQQQYNPYQQQQYNPYQQQYNPYQQQQQYNPYQQQPPMGADAQLVMQDQMMVQQMCSRYPADYRYNQLLNNISSRFNQAGPRVFSNWNTKDVQYIVLAGPLGFNAVAFHQSIVIDSLLMDSLRKLAEGIAFYGKFDTPYTHSLAKVTLQRMQEMQSGRTQMNFNNLENPFNLPSAGNLTPQQQQMAARMFEEMVAGFLSHEGSHGFLEHTKEKMMTQQALWIKNQGKVEPQRLTQEITNYISKDFSKNKEFEADAYAARLLKASGYDKRGIIYWFQLGTLLEQYSGASQNPAERTHPTGKQRTDNVNKVWNTL